MAYYNRNGEMLKKGVMEHLNSGACGAVWHNNEISLKKYFPDTPIWARLATQLFDILRDIDNEHFIKLLEIYYDMNILELIQYKIKSRKFIVDAYTYKYYSDNSVNALYESIDYLLDNFSELEKLFNTFADNGIMVGDIKRGNSILSHDGIVIIDPDAFCLLCTAKKDIALANKIKLLDLFVSICIDGLKGMKNISEMKDIIKYELANIYIDSDTNLTYELSKKLKSVKKPIDYLMK